MSRLALKIAAIHGTTLLFEDRRVRQIDVRSEWIALHDPDVGGYYLIDDDGRATFALTLPDDVPAPPAVDVAMRVVHPADHFQYDWLQKWLELFYAQGEAMLASHDALKAEIAELKASKADA